MGSPLPLSRMHWDLNRIVLVLVVLLVFEEAAQSWGEDENEEDK